MGLQVHLLGKFQVYHTDRALPGFESRRVQELFSYLLLRRQRPHARESLATLLWEDAPAAQSKKYLRQAIWQLQSGLENQPEPHAVLLVDSEWIQINPAAALWLDVTVLEEAYMAVQGIPGRDLLPSQLATLTSIVDLYQGDLLEGWYQDWCIYQRERFQHMYLAILDKLMGHCEAHGNYEAGITYGTAILAYDPARERTHRRLMRLHYLAGDRTAALRQYNRCVAALETELCVPPAQSTLALYEQIKADRLHDLSLPAPAAPAPPLKSAVSSLADSLIHLRQLHDLLAETQGRLQQQIQAVERALKNR